MRPHQMIIKVIYADTDQMGFMHHSNYLKYYEMARWELFRKIGIPYKEIEEKGTIFPVIDMKISYLKPAYYDDKIMIQTLIVKATGARILFNCKMYNQDEILINEATIAIASVRKSNNKPVLLPPEIKYSIDTFLKKQLVYE